MKIFGIEFRKASKKEIASNQSLYAKGPFYTSSFWGTKDKPMLLSAVYRCVDLLSSSIAQLEMQTIKDSPDGFPTQAIEHPAYDLLSLEPNADMTAYSFFKALIVSMLLRGNGYAYISRDNKGQPSSITYLDPSSVTQEWVLDNSGVQVRRYRVQGFTELVEPKNMIHVLNFTYDGLTGVSTLTHAANTIKISASSEAQAGEFFDGGAALSGVLSVETGGRMTPEQRDAIYKQWGNNFNPDSGKRRGIAVLNTNMKYQPISISPKDSQLLESRLYNTVDICRFFGVSPVKAFDLSNSSYSTIEASNLDFLTGSLGPQLANIEQEINRKVFVKRERHTYHAQFNLRNLLRVDRATNAEFNSKMFAIGAKTPNEIRREEGMQKVEGGDLPFVQVNVQPLREAIKSKTDNNDQ